MSETASEAEGTAARRARLMGPHLPTFYDPPLHIVRGEGVWLWDRSGRRYLDCYNNVPHVGHCHPHVVQAIAGQAAALNTHTRYLHDGILDYLDRLTATFDHGLSQTVMVCTGSEANDVAIRMAEAATGRTGLIATDNTYHGNTKAVSQLSTRRPPIGGYPGHVRLVPAPDSLHPVGGDAAAQAQAFADAVRAAIADLDAAGYGLAGFVFCPILANEGLPMLPPGFLQPAVAAVRAAGGLVVADEVQPGFGRTGRWWGHEGAGVVPDIVTLGKPMANGHPVAATVTRPEIMAAFRTSFGYFNTFGGNPVSAAAASAVLDVIAAEDLIAHAGQTGAYALECLRALDHPLIAEARGTGLFLGLALERDGTPATDAAAALVEAMKERGVLIGRIGRAGNVLKLRPPMPISRSQIDMAVGTLEQALAELPE